MNWLKKVLYSTIAVFVVAILVVGCAKKEQTARPFPNLEPYYVDNNKAFQRAKEKISEADLTTIRNAVIDFESRFNRLPNDLNELQKAGSLSGNALLKDPWGTSYQMKVVNNKLYLISAGADKTFGTDDDEQITISK